MFCEYKFKDWLMERLADAHAFSKNGRPYSDAEGLVDELSPLELVCHLGYYLTQEQPHD